MTLVLNPVYSRHTNIHPYTQLISPFYSAETCVHYTFCDQVIIKFKLKTELKIDPMANEDSKTVVKSYLRLNPCDLQSSGAFCRHNGRVTMKTCK